MLDSKLTAMHLVIVLSAPLLRTQKGLHIVRVKGLLHKIRPVAENLGEGGGEGVERQSELELPHFTTLLWVGTLMISQYQ